MATMAKRPKEQPVSGNKVVYLSFSKPNCTVERSFAPSPSTQLLEFTHIFSWTEAHHRLC